MTTVNYSYLVDSQHGLQAHPSRQLQMITSSGVYDVNVHHRFATNLERVMAMLLARLISKRLTEVFFFCAALGAESDCGYGNTHYVNCCDAV
jgi:hypothetical protein